MGAIKVIPYSSSFIKTIVDDIWREKKDNLNQIKIIFTHARSINFFNYYLAQKTHSPLILPYLVTIEELINDLFLNLGGEKTTWTTLNEYEQNYIAYLAAKKVLPDYCHNWGNFFYWSAELVKVFREIDLEKVHIQDILYPPEHVNKIAQNILARLGKLYQQFNAELEQKKLITNWQKLVTLSKLKKFTDASQYYFVGFYALTKAESHFFKTFYQQGATFYWQTDLDNLPDKYHNWLTEWNLSRDNLIALGIKVQKNQRVIFFEGYDFHSELTAVQKNLLSFTKSKIKAPDQVGIVLPDSGGLIPLLFSLPTNLEVNVSIGYPFSLSGVFALIEQLFELVLHKDKNFGYLTSQLLKLFRGPYFKDAPYVQDLTKKLKSADFYLTQNELFRLIPSEFKQHLNKIWSEIILPLENCTSIQDLGQILTKLIEFLIFSPQSKERILEKEFLLSLKQEIFTNFTQTIFVSEELSKRDLFALSKKILERIRVPFAGEPLKGLQVLGMLETRDLSFEHLFILDVNEGTLPASNLPSPLLPQEIRACLGLEQRKEEKIYGYHFERLINSSNNVFLAYQHRNVAGAGLEGKKTKSRFIEKLIWELEKKTGQIFNFKVSKNFAEQNIELQKPNLNLNVPKLTSLEPILKNEVIKKQIQTTLNGSLTISMLNDYLKCPRLFLFKHVLKWKAQSDPEEISFATIGQIIHSGLEKFLKKFLKQDIDKSTLNRDKLDLETILMDQIKKLKLSPVKKEILTQTVKFRLTKFLDNFPQTKIISLERPINLSVTTNGKTYLIKGRIDRIDQRNNLFYILDYKTGYVSKLNIDLGFDVPEELNENSLRLLPNNLPDLQLPFYIYSYGQAEHKDYEQIVGGFIELAKNGQEMIWLNLNNKNKKDYVDFLTQKFPEILKYLLNHILNGPIYGPNLEQQCSFCEYQSACLKYIN